MNEGTRFLISVNSCSGVKLIDVTLKLFTEIKKRVPSFTWDYEIDPVKAQISASWPDCLDDTCAREEWGWNPKWGMDAVIDDMLAACKKKVENGEY